MELDTWPNLVTMFFEQAAARTDRPFLWAKHDGKYRSMSWGEVEDAVIRLAAGLKRMGLKKGDRVVIVAESRPEWFISDLGVMAAGGISVPAYTTNTADDHLHILSDCSARIAIVSTKALADKLLPAVLRAPNVTDVIIMEPVPIRQQAAFTLHHWTEVLGDFDGVADDVRDEAAGLAPDVVACLIYTSGTGGLPKGVMLTHRNIITNCYGAYHLLLTIGLGEEVFLSFLPLSHAYEHTGGQFFPLSLGAQIYYAEGVDTLLTNLGEARPTIMTSVPRLYEMMRIRILRQMEKTGGLKAKLFFKAVELGGKAYEKPESMTLVERLQNRLLDILVRKKINQRFGGRLKAMVSGGAPLPYEVGLFFVALKVPILQGYGQTEAAPVISANPPLRVKVETVGPPLKAVDVRIADDGEILVRGPQVMKGYWNDPESTAKALRDGWLHTGDIGEIDADGYLKITDRKRDIIVNSGGDNVSPQRIEGLLTFEPEIAQAMVYGDRRPHLVALLVPDTERAAQWAGEHGKPKDIESLVGDPDFRRHIGESVARVNRNLSTVEKVRRFHLTSDPFTVQNGLMTPTLKIRRHKIRDIYGPVLEGLYDRAAD